MNRFRLVNAHNKYIHPINRSISWKGWRNRLTLQHHRQFSFFRGAGGQPKYMRQIGVIYGLVFLSYKWMQSRNEPPDMEVIKHSHCFSPLHFSMVLSLIYPKLLNIFQGKHTFICQSPNQFFFVEISGNFG